MAKGIALIVYPVTDRSASVSFFRALLGVDPYVDSPAYVGFKTGETEVGGGVRIATVKDRDDNIAGLRQDA